MTQAQIASMDPLKKRYIPRAVDNVAVDTTVNFDTITQPVEFNMLGGIYFPVAYDLRLTLISTNTQVQILPGVSTYIGNYGFMPFDIPGRADDSYALSVLTKATPGITYPINICITLFFYQDNAQPQVSS